MAKRGPYAKTESRRRELADAALSLVIDRGHNNVTAVDVARLAHASVPTVFYHFPTMVDLLVAALERFDDLQIDPLRDGGALAAVAERAVEGVHRTNIVRLHSELAGESIDPAHPAHSYFKTRWTRSRQVLADDIRRLQAVGDVSEQVEADHVARCVLAAWEGLQMQWLLSPDFDMGAELNKLIVALSKASLIGAETSSSSMHQDH